jgi:hypothetical protein
LKKSSVATEKNLLSLVCAATYQSPVDGRENIDHILILLLYEVS